MNWYISRGLIIIIIITGPSTVQWRPLLCCWTVPHFICSKDFIHVLKFCYQQELAHHTNLWLWFLLWAVIGCRSPSVQCSPRWGGRGLTPRPLGFLYWKDKYIRWGLVTVSVYNGSLSCLLTNRSVWWCSLLWGGWPSPPLCCWPWCFSQSWCCSWLLLWPLAWQTWPCWAGSWPLGPAERAWLRSLWTAGPASLLGSVCPARLQFRSSTSGADRQVVHLFKSS